MYAEQKKQRRDIGLSIAFVNAEIQNARQEQPPSQEKLKALQAELKTLWMHYKMLYTE